MTRANPDMADAHALAGYEEWHAGLDVDEGGDTPWQRMVLQVAGSLIQGSRVMEIGCGRGGFVPALLAAGARQIVAADFSETAVAKARSYAEAQGLSDVEFRVEDIEAIKLPPEQFDVVVSCETIEHVPHPERAVAELARILRPGGHLVLTTPNYLSTIGLHRAWRAITGRPYTEGGQPICHLTMLPRTLRWVRSAGLKPLHVASTGYAIPVPWGSTNCREIPIPRPLRYPASWVGRHSLVVATKSPAGSPRLMQ